MKQQLNLCIKYLLTLLSVLAMLANVATAESTYGMTEYLLGGYGIAQGQYVLRANPSEEFMRNIQPIGLTAEDDDIRFTVTEAMCDGETLAISWLTENLKPETPALVQAAHVTVNGETVYLWNTDLADTFGWSPPMFSLGSYGKRLAPKRGGMVTYKDNMVAGFNEVSIELAVSRPTSPLVIVDPFLYLDVDGLSDGSMDDYAQMLEDVEASGILVAGENELDEKLWLDKGYIVIDSAGTIWGGSQYSYDTIYWIYEDQLERTGTIQLNFMVSADMGPDAAREIKPTGSYMLGDLTLRFERLFMSPLTTIIKAEFVAAEESDLLDIGKNLIPRFLFFDDEGYLLDTVNRDFMYGMDNPEEKDGQWICRLSGDPFPGTISPAAKMAVGLSRSFGWLASVQKLEDLENLTVDFVIIPLDAE